MMLGNNKEGQKEKPKGKKNTHTKEKTYIK